MLSIKNISVSVGSGSCMERQILKDLSLEVKSGEFVSIIGGNGTGKSTLFNVISGYIRPESGKVFIDGKDVTADNQIKRAKDVSIVMQDPRMGTVEELTLYENMAFALKRGQFRGGCLYANMSRKQLIQEKLAVLEMGLENRLYEPVATLSGGQRQALSLVMAMLGSSQILLLDEITAALDPEMSERVMELANSFIRKEQRTCLMITHSMDQATRYGDRVIELKNGAFK
jgi:putative tryptophan/tyrosine transport system ATP-binding protein